MYDWDEPEYVSDEEMKECEDAMWDRADDIYEERELERLSL